MAEPYPQVICRHLCTPSATMKGHLDQQCQRQQKPTVNEPRLSSLPTKSHSIYAAIIDPTNQQALPTVTLPAISPSNPIVVPTTFLCSMSMTVTPFSYAYSATASPMKSNVSSPAPTII